ncbi:MAG: hypothetical protein JWP44_3106 [Mucilaginibacter sp.]|nr:hypothetical protein [Mucilaginibacter sp.]
MKGIDWEIVKVEGKEFYRLPAAFSCYLCPC